MKKLLLLLAVTTLSCTSTPTVQQQIPQVKQQNSLEIPSQFIGNWIGDQEPNYYLKVTKDKIVFNQLNGQIIEITDGIKGAQYNWEFTLFLPSNGAYVMTMFGSLYMRMNYSENGVWRGSIFFKKQ